MDYQKVVDGLKVPSCVVSIEKLANGGTGVFRLVAGNRAYLDSIEKPMEGMEMLSKQFVPNSDYTNYLPRDLNFEDACTQAGIHGKCVHAYVSPDRFQIWMDLSFIPLESDDENLGYCLYIMQITFKADAKRMSNISSDIATSVLETCVKLRSPDNFEETMAEVCKDIRDLCDSEHCCVFLMDTAARKCSVLCEAFSENTKLLPMSNYVDDKFYDIAESWEATIAGSNCLIIKNEHDMEAVRERNPVWVNSISSAGGKTIVLFPLKFKGELLGYIWAINFSDQKADTIKETLELTTFILASELYSYRMLERLHILSSRDMLTGVMNRNEMNNYIISLVGSDKKQSVGVLFADLNGLKTINDSEGHIAGDRLLRDAASALKEIFEMHEIFRAGGDEFAIIVTDTNEAELAEKAELIREKSKRYPDLHFAIGVAYEENLKDVRKALHLADERMYADKKRYYEAFPERKRR